MEVEVKKIVFSINFNVTSLIILCIHIFWNISRHPFTMFFPQDLTYAVSAMYVAAE